MTGRDNERGRGRGGRGYRGGRGRGRSTGRRQQGRGTPPKKQLEMKFFPHGIGRETQTVTYDTVKEHIVQFVQKTYKNGQDIAVSLRDLKVKDLEPLAPIRGVSEKDQQADKEADQKGMDIQFQAELERYLERKDTLEQNLSRAYALILQTYCNKTMQNRIEEHAE